MGACVEGGDIGGARSITEVKDSERKESRDSQGREEEREGEGE